MDPVQLEFLIPYHGDPAYLLEAVEAIRALEDTDWILTVVEDAYPDGAAVEEKVAALGDPRIRYRRNERNLGVSANIHRCIQLAERDLAVVTGADDRVLPHYGRVVAGLLDRHPDAALIHPAVQVVDENGTPYRPLADRIKGLSWPRAEAQLRGEPAVRSLLRGNWLYTPALCFRREALQRAPFRAGFDAVSDLGYVVDVLVEGGSLVVGTEVAFAYRRHRHNHSSSFARSGERFRQERAYFTAIGAELRDQGWRRAERAARLRLLSRLHAAVQLPQAVRSRQGATVRTLLGHALG